MENRILAIQRRHMPAYRIRGGDAQGGQPRALTDEVRITSPSRATVEAFADVFGGKPKRWRRGNVLEHEVYLPTHELPVELLPGQALTQSMELWAGSVCQRRCDGITMQDGDPCACGPQLPVGERECKPTTRLSVIVPSVAVVGTGMLVTHSVIAAETLPQQVDLAMRALAAGYRIPHKLVWVNAKGAGTRYTYPKLVPDHQGEASLGALMDGLAIEAGNERPALNRAPVVTAPADWLERAANLSQEEKRELGARRRDAGLPSLTKPMTEEQLAAYGELLDSIAPVEGMLE